jgi:hypothetical protein
MIGVMVATSPRTSAAAPGNYYARPRPGLHRRAGVAIIAGHE